MLTLARRELTQLWEGTRTGQRLPFLPITLPYAARLVQSPIKSLYADPAKLVNALVLAHRQVGGDGLFNHWDPVLEGEALGCTLSWPDEHGPPQIQSHPLDGANASRWLEANRITQSGRVPVVLEATKRLVMAHGHQTAVWARVTGPLSLSAQLRGPVFWDELSAGDPAALDLAENAGEAILALVRRYFEIGVFGVTVVETELPREADLNPLDGALRTISNIARHFGGRVMLALSEAGPDYWGLPVDGFLLLGDEPETAGPPPGFSVVLGLPLPLDKINRLDRLGTWIQDTRRRFAGLPLLITTRADLLSTLTPERVRAVVDLLYHT